MKEGGGSVERAWESRAHVEEEGGRGLSPSRSRTSKTVWTMSSVRTANLK